MRLSITMRLGLQPGDETYGLLHPHCFHPHLSIGLKVTKVQCQLPHQCNQGLIDLEVPGIQTAANDAAGSLEAIWQSTCWSLRGRKWKTPSLIKAGVGTWWCIAVWSAETALFSPMLAAPCKAIQGSWLEVKGQTSLQMEYSPYWMSIKTISRP